MKACRSREMLFGGRVAQVQALPAQVDSPARAPAGAQAMPGVAALFFICCDCQEDIQPRDPRHLQAQQAKVVMSELATMALLLNMAISSAVSRHTSETRRSRCFFMPPT